VNVNLNVLRHIDWVGGHVDCSDVVNRRS